MGDSCSTVDVMTILLTHPRVTSIPVVECGDPLVRLDTGFGPARALVRSGLADRLNAAQGALPRQLRLRVIEGHRSPAAQQAIITDYTGQLRAEHPELPAEELRHLSSRFVAPLEVAPHVAGAAVDLTLVDLVGNELDLGTAIDETPEQSQGRCYFAAADIGRAARVNRQILAEALGAAGFVNYPTEWWHWSFGDRYWALLTAAPAAIYGPASADLQAVA